MALKTSQIETIDSLLSEIGFNEGRRRNAILHIRTFFDVVKKNPNRIIKTDIDNYLGNKKNNHLKSWMRVFYSDLLPHLQYHKLTRFDERFLKLGLAKDYIRYIREITNFYKKPVCRINRNDVDNYISYNNFADGELIKVRNIFKNFNGDGQNKKIMIFDKAKKEINFVELLPNRKTPVRPIENKIAQSLEKKVSPKKKSAKEKREIIRKIEEKTMERANKNVHQNIELSNIDLQKYTPIANAPCLGCNQQCYPESCMALNNYTLMGL